jgi:AcrR family transcriptional regulator
MDNSTQKRLQLALVRLKRGRPKVVSKKRKLSISAVAEEAGVSDSTIHNRYPEIAAEVRQIAGRLYKMQRDEKSEKLKSVKDKNRELRNFIENLESENRKAASIIMTLKAENEQLKAEFDNENIVRINQK